MTETPTATLPEPATLTMMARMLALGSRGDPSRASSSCSCLSAGNIQEGSTDGAWSDAVTVTSPPVITVEPLIAAVTVLATALPSAETETATFPDPETPMASARTIADDVEVRSSVESVSSVEPPILVLTVFVITLAAIAPPPAASPPPAPPNASASITESSAATSDTGPLALTVDPLETPASTVLLMVFTDRPIPAANPLEPAPPNVTLMICELLMDGRSTPEVPSPIASRSAAFAGGSIPAVIAIRPPVDVALDASICARIVFSTYTVDAATPTAALDDPANPPATTTTVVRSWA